MDDQYRRPRTLRDLVRAGSKLAILGIATVVAVPVVAAREYLLRRSSRRPTPKTEPYT